MKICVIGGGRWGRNHIRTLSKSGNLGGIVDPNKKLLDEYHEIYPNVNFFVSDDKKTISVPKKGGWGKNPKPSKLFDFAGGGWGANPQQNMRGGDWLLSEIFD